MYGSIDQSRTLSETRIRSIRCIGYIGVYIGQVGVFVWLDDSKHR